MRRRVRPECDPRRRTAGRPCSWPRRWKSAAAGATRLTECSIIGPTQVSNPASGQILEFNRTDFGANWNKTLEAGGVLVDETVYIEIGAEGQKQSS